MAATPLLYRRSEFGYLLIALLAAVLTLPPAQAEQDNDSAPLIQRIQSQGLWHPESQKQLLQLFENDSITELQTALKNAARVNDDAQAQANYGNFLMASSFFEDNENAQSKAIEQAYELLENALKADKLNWDARMGYASLMLYSVPYYGYASFAEDTMLSLLADQEKLTPQPQFVQAYLQFGDYYQGQKDPKAAQDIFQRGLKYFPENENLLNASKQTTQQ